MLLVRAVRFLPPVSLFRLACAKVRSINCGSKSDRLDLHEFFCVSDHFQQPFVLKTSSEKCSTKRLTVPTRACDSRLLRRPVFHAPTVNMGRGVCRRCHVPGSQSRDIQNHLFLHHIHLPMPTASFWTRLIVVASIIANMLVAIIAAEAVIAIRRRFSLRVGNPGTPSSNPTPNLGEATFNGVVF